MADEKKDGAKEPARKTVYVIYEKVTLRNVPSMPGEVEVWIERGEVTTASGGRAATRQWFDAHEFSQPVTLKAVPVRNDSTHTWRHSTKPVTVEVPGQITVDEAIGDAERDVGRSPVATP